MKVRKSLAHVNDLLFTTRESLQIFIFTILKSVLTDDKGMAAIYRGVQTLLDTDAGQIALEEGRQIRFIFIPMLSSKLGFNPIMSKQDAFKRMGKGVKSVMKIADIYAADFAALPITLDHNTYQIYGLLEMFIDPCGSDFDDDDHVVDRVDESKLEELEYSKGFMLSNKTVSDIYHGVDIKKVTFEFSGPKTKKKSKRTTTKKETRSVDPMDEILEEANNESEEKSGNHVILEGIKWYT